MNKLSPLQMPIRLRLTLWYVLLMAVTFAAFGVFLFARFQRTLIASLDASLRVTVRQTIASFDPEEDLAENGRLAFEQTGGDAAAGFAMRLVSGQGEVWDSFGNSPADWGVTAPGYTTQKGAGDEESWRVFTQPILAKDGTGLGWLQAAQSFESVSDTLQDFRDQLLLGVPLVLLLAGLGGYFLANRALRPIQHIAATAQEITAHDLSRRLAYRGPEDEIGRLARTFDGMLERLHAAFRRERRFTGDAAHELRTPLTVLKGQIDVTLSQPRKREEYEIKLQELGTHVDRLIRLSNALLFLSRSDQNQLAWEPAALNLKDSLDVILAQIRPLAEEKGQTLQADIPAGLMVIGDPDHLTRLFLNLLDNALKYTPPAGQITVRATRALTRTEVTIHNSGPGIPAEHLPYLFDRFYRVDNARSSETGGTGLGLAIAQEIVRLHGGEMGVESEPEKGVTVKVRLPNS